MHHRSEPFVKPRSEASIKGREVVAQMRGEAMETARPKKQDAGCADGHGAEYPYLRVGVSARRVC